MFKRFRVQIDELDDKILNAVAKAMDVTLLKMQGEIRAKSRVDTGQYKQSILVEKPKIEGTTVSGKVFSNLKANPSSAKWGNTALGIFIEYGTGVEGGSTVSAEAIFSGLAYRRNGWVFYWKDKGRYVFTTGMKARPHFLPTLQDNEQVYIENIKKEWRKVI